jgi:calcium-dependent protein kinase
MTIFDEILDSLDKNRNGVIDYTEFLVAAADKELLLTEANLRFAFNMFDKDGNGSISKPELKEVF